MSELGCRGQERECPPLQPIAALMGSLPSQLFLFHPAAGSNSSLGKTQQQQETWVSGREVLERMMSLHN